jgi:cytochrome c553
LIPEIVMTRNKKGTIVWLIGVLAVAIAYASVTTSLISRPAAATPAFAASTGQPCAACHVRPDGGTELTAYGKAFQANGNKPPKP